MPLPIVASAAAALAGAFGQRATSYAMDYIIAEPEQRTKTYFSNTRVPNLIPSPTEIIALYHGGQIRGGENLKNWLLCHGIQWGQGRSPDYSVGIWDAIVARMRAKPDVALILELRNQGRISPEEASARLHELGWSSRRERELVLGLEAPLNAGEVYELYWRGSIDRDEALKRLETIGIRDSRTAGLHLDRRPPLNLQDVRDLELRRLLPRGDFERYLARMGVTDKEDVERMKSLLTFMPPVSDLIRFAVKDVFDPRKAGLLDMRAELVEQQELLSLLDAQGIRDLTIPNKDGQSRKWEIPLYYWIASYEELAPGQSYEFMHRLRPNRVRRYRFTIDPATLPPGIEVPAGTRKVRDLPGGNIEVEPEPFELADVLKALKDKDVNPVYRTRHAATSFRPPGRIDVRRFYQDGVYGAPLGTRGWRDEGGGKYAPTGVAEKELYEVYQDEGRSPYDAAQMGYWTSLNWDRERGDAERSRVAKLACKSYQLGAINRAELIERLERLGYQPREAIARADNCDLDYRVSVLDTSVKAVRSAFLGGRIDDLQTGRHLADLNIAPERVGNFIKLWKLERIAKAPEPRAAQMCEWVGMGLLTTDEMRLRLTRLGWSPEDVDRIARHCVLGHLGRAAKEQERRAMAEVREAERRRLAMERLQRRKEQERRRILDQIERELRRREGAAGKGHTTSLLSRYLRRGVISRDEAAGLLSRSGWEPADVARYLATV